MVKIMSYRCSECRNRLDVTKTSIGNNDDNEIIGIILKCEKHGKVRIDNKYITSSALFDEVDLFVKCVYDEESNDSKYIKIYKILREIIIILFLIGISMALAIGIMIVLTGISGKL